MFPKVLNDIEFSILSEIYNCKHIVSIDTRYLIIHVPSSVFIVTSIGTRINPLQVCCQRVTSVILSLLWNKTDFHFLDLEM